MIETKQKLLFVLYLMLMIVSLVALYLNSYTFLWISSSLSLIFIVIYLLNFNKGSSLKIIIKKPLILAISVCFIVILIYFLLDLFFSLPEFETTMLINVITTLFIGTLYFFLYSQSIQKNKKDL
ncbi:hypothetical protein [Bacillus sp. FJAT-52991]|uniref:Permease n=1 Tax=Bacillus kandeliae TaxID=3129297 RepID=A0ABZ2NCJ5_9BACI